MKLKYFLTRLVIIALLTAVSACSQGHVDKDQSSVTSVAQRQSAEASSNSTKRPNILLIVADDLGAFDIGAYGSEIRTPNIDRLVQSGVSLSNFYTSATCSPTRAMLLSGTESHVAGLGNMKEHLAPNQTGEDGYEGYLSDDVVSVARLLKDDGYRTYMAGKWHLGMKPEHLPNQRGFDESFVLLQGGASYFNDMRGLVSKAPKALYRHNDKVVSALPDSFYASEFYADFIIDNIANQKPEQAPFFAYLAFTAPHWPLHVKDEHLDLYKGEYDEGYDALHQRRMAEAVKRGFLKPSLISSEKPQHVPDWEALSDQEKKVQRRAMEIYSATVERMDFHLGRVLEFLERKEQLDNTLIVFMSDNGADGSDRSKLPGNTTWLPQEWDLSYENMGKKGSYVYPGAGWARASVGPYNMYKEFLSEGGIRSPAVVSFGQRFTPNPNFTPLISVQDIMPTMLEAAGVTHPGETYQGRPIQVMIGDSFLKQLSSKSVEPPSVATEKIIRWELFGQRAIRKGDWKLLWLSSKPKWLVQPRNADNWRLYNLTDDPSELHDLSTQNTTKLEEMIAEWEAYAVEHNVVLPSWE